MAKSSKKRVIENEDTDSEDEYGTPIWVRKLEVWLKTKAVEFIIQKHLDDETTEILEVIVETYNTELVNNTYSQHCKTEQHLL